MYEWENISQIVYNLCNVSVKMCQRDCSKFGTYPKFLICKLVKTYKTTILNKMWLIYMNKGLGEILNKVD